jgi:hypothetical protein
MADTAITDTEDMEHGFDGFDEPSDTDGRATDEAEAETGAADQDERADGSAPRKQSASASATKTTARRAIMKYEDVRDADEQVVNVLVAASEGMPANGNRIDIAIRLVSAGRLQLRALDRIDQIAAESDPFDQMAYALSASDADQRRIWDVLAEGCRHRQGDRPRCCNATQGRHRSHERCARPRSEVGHHDPLPILAVHRW